MRLGLQFRLWMALGIVVLIVAPTAFGLAACCTMTSAEHDCCGNGEGYRQAVSVPPCCAVSAPDPAQPSVPAGNNVAISPVAHVQVAVETALVSVTPLVIGLTPSPPHGNSVLRI